jgi:hypothetical protein
MLEDEPSIEVVILNRSRYEVEELEKAMELSPETLWRFL